MSPGKKSVNLVDKYVLKNYITLWDFDKYFYHKYIKFYWLWSNIYCWSIAS